MMEGTNQHNGTIQRADFRLIHPALRWSYQITAKKTPINHEEKKGYLTRNIRTRLLWKELGHLMNDRDHSRKVKDNSEDKIRYITSNFKNRRLQILQDPTNSAPRKAK